MVVRVLPYLDDLLPLAVSVVALAALAPVIDLDRDLLARAGVAAVGSTFAAYGLREVLRAWGGGYYCCNHGFHAGLGLVIAAVGWVFLVGALRAPSSRRTERPNTGRAPGFSPADTKPGQSWRSRTRST